jgi:hypothetical protein
MTSKDHAYKTCNGGSLCVAVSPIFPASARAVSHRLSSGVVAEGPSALHASLVRPQCIARDIELLKNVPIASPKGKILYEKR